MTKHVYPIIPDIGLKVHKTFVHKFIYFEHEWKFRVRSQSEANLARGCLTYYKAMWDAELFEPINHTDTVVDVGAHVGFFAIPISCLVKKVIAFEPSPANFILLDRNITANQSAVLPRQAAVGESGGSAILNLGVQGTTGHSITNKKRGGVSISVICWSLSDVINTYNPTVLKLDCEGAEWDILANPDLLGNIRIIVAELHKVQAHDLPTMLKVMKKAGMKVIVLPNSWFTKLIAYRR